MEVSSVSITFSRGGLEFLRLEMEFQRLFTVFSCCRREFGGNFPHAAMFFRGETLLNLHALLGNDE